jgi:hypothetical protein
LTEGSTTAGLRVAAHLRSLSSAVPGVAMIRAYRRDWLPADSLAALTVWAMVSANNVDQELGWCREEYKRIGVEHALLPSRA